MALPPDAQKLLVALWHVRNANREERLSVLGADLGFDDARIRGAYTALSRYEYVKPKGTSSERGLPYPAEIVLTPPGIAAAAALIVPAGPKR